MKCASCRRWVESWQFNGNGLCERKNEITSANDACDYWREQKPKLWEIKVKFYLRACVYSCSKYQYFAHDIEQVFDYALNEIKHSQGRVVSVECEEVTNNALER